MPFRSAAPSGDSGSPVMRAAKSRAASPARSVAPTPEPAEVPTITAAVRGSQSGHLRDRRQRAGVVGVTDHPTSTEHEANGRHVFNGRMRVGAF